MAMPDEKQTVEHPDWPKRKEAILATYPTDTTSGDMRLHRPGLVTTRIKSSPEFKELMSKLLDQFREPSKEALRELEQYAFHKILDKLIGGNKPAVAAKRGK